MTKKRLLSLLIITTISVSFFGIKLALAQGGVIPPPSGGGDGDYSLNDFITLAVKVSQLILGLVGSLSLLMFVYGGVMFLLSAGSSEKVTKAKNILVASVVGLLIVFSSFLIIRFVISTMGITNTFDGRVDTSQINSKIII